MAVATIRSFSSMAFEKFSKDPLLSLPLLPSPPRSSSSSGRSRSRHAHLRSIRARCNGALRSLSHLFQGDLRGLHSEQEYFGTSDEWENSRGLPRLVGDRVLRAHLQAHEEQVYGTHAESAFVRLTASPGAVQYGGPPDAEGRVCNGPLRGEILPLSSGVASLPVAGSAPTPLTVVSPKAKRWFQNFRNLMLVSPDELDMCDVGSTKVYEDPSLKCKSRRISFAAQLWKSGMLNTCRHKICQVSVFFVMKKNENGVNILRPVWDCRMINKCFQKP